MGVRILVGTVEGSSAAAMVDAVTGRMVGPIFEAVDAEEQVEAFLEWLRGYPFVSQAEEIGLTSNEVPFLGTTGLDPRHWGVTALEKLVGFWRAENVEDGLLRRVAPA